MAPFVMAQQERIETREQSHGLAIASPPSQVREVLRQQESATAVPVHLDELVPEAFHRRPNGSHVDPGPHPEVLRIRRTERSEVPSDERLLRLLRGDRRRIVEPSIDSRERDLLSGIRTEAHEASDDRGPHEMPRETRSLGLPPPPSIGPLFPFRGEPLRQKFGELISGERSVLEGLEHERGGLLFLQAEASDPSLVVGQPRRHEPGEDEEELLRW